MLFTPKLTAQNNLGKGRVINHAGAFGQSVNVIPRAYCAFRRIKLKGTHQAALKAAKMRAHNEARPGDDCIRIIKDKNGKGASVWSYNSRFETGLRSLPESLCSPPLENGARLMACLEGVEGQVWENGKLIASRWWPSDPSEAQWYAFLRVAPFEFTDDLPLKPTVAPAIYRTDLSLFGVDTHRIENILSPSQIAAALAFVGLCSTIFMGAQHFRYKTELNTVEANKVEISQASRQVLAKRRKALRNAAEVEKYTSFENEGSLLSGLQSLTTVLKGEDVKIQSVKLKDDEMEFRISNQTKLAGPKLVNALEASPTLQSVTISQGPRNSFTIKAKISSYTAEAKTNSIVGSDTP